MSTALIDYIEKHTERSTRAGRNMYNCPFCNSGSGANRTGALGVYENGTKWKCFSCGKNGDLGDFIAEIEHISAGEGLKRARELYGDFKPISQPVKEKDPTDFTANIDEWASDVFLTDYYKKRGFSDDTVKRFRLGYNQSTNTAKIPVNNNCVIYRKLDSGADRSKGFDSGSKNAIFNLNDLYNKNGDPVYLCEGWADALSVYECGGYAISCNSENMYNLILKQLESKPTKSELIIAFDTDKAGQTGAQALENGLKKLGYSPTYFDFNNAPEGVHDLNEYFLTDREAFECAMDATEAKLNSYNENYINAQIDDIIEQFKTGKHSAKSTGFKAVDDILGGGLFSGLTVVGAESSQGKSTLVMNIAENMAEAGEDVLYFALEMTKAQLIARGLSKQSFLFNGKQRGYTSAEIKQNKVLDIDNYINAYKKKIGARMIIIENFTGMTIEEIRERVILHITKTGRVPVIVIDYLQMISDNTRQTEKQQTDHSIEILKGLSAEYGAHVLAISSLNRASYGEPVKMDAFKESGKIEYTADFVLGLSLSATKKGKLTANEIDYEMKRQPREMSLQLLKGRDVETRKSAELRYYSAYNYFEDVLTGWQPPKRN